jgi:hypothetical protein
MNARRTIVIVGVTAALAAALAAVGCGSASSTSPTASATPAATASSAATPGTAASSPASTAQGPGALTGEAASAAAGDVPDNQVFLTLHDKAGGFSMKYPEGWAQQSKAGALTIQDKNNVVRLAAPAFSEGVFAWRSFSCWSTTAVVDMGTPQGVDNVDAYRLMIESFTWAP